MTHRSKDEREMPVFSASSILDAIGEALTIIRREDGLTFSDMAAILGKSDDQAAKYCAGSAAMDAITYARAKREWNGRFTGQLDRLIADTRPKADADRTRHSKVLRAALALAEALEDDNEISPQEVRANRGTIEDARDALDELLRKIVRAA